MATISSTGMATGIDWNSMISAILDQEGQPVQRLQDRQTANNARLKALQGLQTNLNALSSSLSTLGGTSFNARSVSSTDTTGTYVSATATGSAAGSYDLLVNRVATKGRIAPALTYGGTSSDPSVLSFGSATAKTTTGSVGFTIDSYTAGGAVSGTFTVGGTSYTLTGTNGTLSGTTGTPLEGLTVSVSGTGTGTLTLSGGTPSNLAVADPLATPVFAGGSASFAIQGTDGVIKTLTLGAGNNSLYGLRDAINALGQADPNVAGSKGLGVVASVVNTGSGANPYQLVLTAKDTGSGTTGGQVRIADITAGGAVNSLGIAAGSVDDASAPTTISGGLASSGTDVAQDALFTVNGIQLTRKTNTVSDVVDGVTFSLKQGGQTAPTTLTVAVDKSAITSAMQDVVTKFNALLSAYKTASAAGGALANDSPSRSFLSQVRAALSGKPGGLGGGATFTSAADLGLKTNRDGTLSLDTTAFQAALDKDPDAAKRVFANSGTSTNAAVAFYAMGTKTTTGDIGFNITSFVSGGAVSGTFTVGGSTYTLSGSGGNLVGAVGTPLEGLILNVKGTGSGTLTVSRGLGQATQDAISGMTAYGTGGLSQILNSIQTQNFNLSRQITDGQARLDRRKTALQAQFAQIESTVSQLQSAGQSLSGLR